MVGYGTLVASAVAAADVAAGAEGVLADFTAPLVPGTYTLRLTLAKAGTYAVATDLTTEVSMKVAALSSFSTGVSTVYINDSAAAAGTATTDAAGASGIKTAATIAANISVDLERANGDDYASGTFYAYVDGPGLIDIVADNTDFNGDLTDASTCTALCRSDSLASDGLFNISFSRITTVSAAKTKVDGEIRASSLAFLSAKCTGTSCGFMAASNDSSTSLGNTENSKPAFRRISFLRGELDARTKGY
jgi:hypothetical protein